MNLNGSVFYNDYQMSLSGSRVVKPGSLTDLDFRPVSPDVSQQRDNLYCGSCDGVEKYCCHS